MCEPQPGWRRRLYAPDVSQLQQARYEGPRRALAISSGSPKKPAVAARSLAAAMDTTACPVTEGNLTAQLSTPRPTNSRGRAAINQISGRNWQKTQWLYRGLMLIKDFLEHPDRGIGGDLSRNRRVRTCRGVCGSCTYTQLSGPAPSDHTRHLRPGRDMSANLMLLPAHCQIDGVINKRGGSMTTPVARVSRCTCRRPPIGMGAPWSRDAAVRMVRRHRPPELPGRHPTALAHTRAGRSRRQRAADLR